MTALVVFLICTKGIILVPDVTLSSLLFHLLGVTTLSPLCLLLMLTANITDVCCVVDIINPLGVLIPLLLVINMF